MSASRCLDAAQLARAATTGERDPHLDECLACRRRLEADRATRDALRALPAPVLSDARRRELAAELDAIAQHAPARRRWSRAARVAAAAATSATALAAAAALVARWPSPLEPAVPPPPAFAAAEPVGVSSASAARLEPPAVLPPPRIDASGGATLAHLAGPDRDVVTLADGIVEIDTREARDVDVKIGDAIVHVDDAAVKIHARGRQIVSVQVVVGAARVTSPDQRVTLQRDSLWLPGPSAKARSLEAFRDAWLALRAGRNREAVELFDRVTDPVALEEATYWAAIAARRSGDAALADQRLAAFLQKFPRSEYAARLQAESR